MRFARAFVRVMGDSFRMVVIPEAAKRLSGIHNLRTIYGFVAMDPGSRCARPG
jgi:hypothetical protein